MKDTTPTGPEAKALLALGIMGEMNIRGIAWIRLEEDFKASPHAPDYDRDCQWWSVDELQAIAKGEVA